jgi:hypothetical protein
MEAARPVASDVVEPLPAPLRPDGPERVVIHASLRGLLTAATTPIALIALGGAAVAAGGFRLLPAALLVGGIGLALVVLFDLPRRTVFDRGGLTRVCWLRRQRLPWDRIVALERTRPSSVSVARNAMQREDGPRDPRVSGGLVARGSGRRRWLLSDQVEARSEHDRLRALLDEVPSAVALRAPRPHESAPPTDLYRRRRAG